jgi:ribosomal protein L12E/L44/L45/RPP1/RPP2
MSAVVIDDQTLRGLLKEALIEVMQERPELLSAMLAEAMEEVGLAEAIRQGAQTATVAKSTVLQALE